MDKNNENHEIEYIYDDEPHGVGHDESARGAERDAERGAERGEQPARAIIIDHNARADNARADENRQRETPQGVHFTFTTFGGESGSFDGANFRSIKLDWKSRLIFMAVASLVAVIVIGFAISAAIALLVLAAVGAVVYGISRLVNSIQGR